MANEGEGAPLMYSNLLLYSTKPILFGFGAASPTAETVASTGVIPVAAGAEIESTSFQALFMICSNLRGSVRGGGVFGRGGNEGGGDLASLSLKRWRFGSLASQFSKLPLDGSMDETLCMSGAAPVADAALPAVPMTDVVG